MNFDVQGITIQLTTFIYRCLRLNIYFICSNILLIASLIFLQPTWNNLVFFLVPMYFFFVSISVYFKTIAWMKESYGEVCKFREFIEIYKKMFTSYWKMYVTCLVGFVVITVDLQILISQKGMFGFVIPLMMTFGFLLNSMFFVFQIATDERFSQLKTKEVLMKSLILSYKLPMITLQNMIYILISFYALCSFPLVSLVFVNGLLFYLIVRNIEKKFDVALFMEQVGV